MVLALNAEQAINPSVLVSGQSHIIDVRSRLAVFGHSDRSWPETEIVHSVRALRNRKERLAVIGLHSHDEKITTVPLYRSAVKCCVDAYALHKERIGLFVKIVAPFERRVRSCQDRIYITLVNPVNVNCLILSCQKGFVFCPESV